MLKSIDNKTAFLATGERTFDPARRTLVFLHGAAQDHSIWVLPKRYFVRRGDNVLDLDFPGHGRSQGPALQTVEEMADWLVHCLDACQLQTAIVIGHSMGSLVALDTAARYPERVDKLVLLGSSAPMLVADRLLDAAVARPQDAFAMMNQWGHSRQAAMGGCPTPGLWMTGMGMRLFERSLPGIVANDLTACRNYTDAPVRADVVACPTLVIMGESDVMTPPSAGEALAARVESAQTVHLPGAGHAMLIERPEEILDAVIDFIE